MTAFVILVIVFLAILSIAFSGLLLCLREKFSPNSTGKKKEPNTEDKLDWKIKLSIIVGIGLIVFSFFAPFLLTKLAPTSKLSFSTTGQIGDTVGGLMNPFIALAGVIVTGLAFYMQYKANQLQRRLFNEQQKSDREQFERQLSESKEQFNKQISKQTEDTFINRLEGRFFELIGFHRNNVELMVHSYVQILKLNYNGSLHDRPEYTMQRIETGGRSVFREIKNDFLECYKETSWYFENITENAVYEKEYLKTLKQNETIVSRNIDVKKLAQIDILYLVIFYGVGEDGVSIIKDFCKDRYEGDFIGELLFFLSLKPKAESDFWWEWNNINNLSDPEDKKSVINEIKKDREPPKDFVIIWDEAKKQTFGFPSYTYPDQLYIPSNSSRFYRGYENLLGHYFRNIFQAIRYIDKQINLDYKEKYSYARILRAQLSVDEQIVFFLNSLSILGRIWELENKRMTQNAIPENEHLITKYNFIKNIHFNKIADGINVQQFYPAIAYESFASSNILEVRRKLENDYKQY